MTLNDFQLIHVITVVITCRLMQFIIVDIHTMMTPCDVANIEFDAPSVVFVVYNLNYFLIFKSKFFSVEIGVTPDE